MKTTLYRLFPLAIILLAGGVFWLFQDRQDAGPQQTLVCPNLHAGCTVDLDGQQVHVAFQGELKSLQAFQLKVEAPRAGKVEARFTMEGMDMGFNLYTLRADKKGTFLAKVTLPVCVSGRRDWVMNLRVDGAQLAVPFVTDL